MMQQDGQARLDIVVTVDLSEWLQLTAKARSNNLPLIIPPGGTVSGDLVADNSLPYVIVDALQFAGVLTAQIAFEFLAGIQRLAGWAVPDFIQQEILLSEKGRPIHYTITSSQATAATLNIDYLSLDSQVVDNELMPALWRIALGAR